VSAGDVASRDQSRDGCASATQSRCCAADGVSVSGSGRATPARCRRASSGDRDDDVTTTTTSGSYTVDGARELSSEIDEMFFTSGSTNV